MEDYIGKVCPYCKTEIKAGDAVKVCPSCGIPHHDACWTENSGCTTPDCPERHCEEQQTTPAEVCGMCGASLGDGQVFCPKCGTPRVALKKKECSNCGAKLEDDQQFCSKCGTKVDAPSAPPAAAAINQFNTKVAQTRGKSRKTPIIAAIAAVGVIAVIAVVLINFTGKKVDFNKLYDEYCSPYFWATVGSDGSYLLIDTNPYDWDDDGLAYPEAYTAIKEVNSALGLPDSLINEMGKTTGADGKQTEKFDNLGIIVSWKYHPDIGLEVTYKKAK